MKRAVLYFFVLLIVDLYAIDNKDINKTQKESDFYYLQVYVNKTEKPSSLNRFNSSSSYQTNSLGEAALMMGLSAVFSYKSVLKEVKQYELPHFHKKLQNDFTFMKIMDAKEADDRKKYKVEIYDKE